MTNPTGMSDFLLLLRFTVGYPAMTVAGFVLGVIALGRLRLMTNGRRRLYRPLVSVAFGLCWIGVWGVLGVWQYGKFTIPLPFPMVVVSVAFSIGILWIALSLVVLASIVLVEEFQRARTIKDSKSHTAIHYH